MIMLRSCCGFCCGANFTPVVVRLWSCQTWSCDGCMICLPCYYTLLTLCLRFATRAELKEGRERSIFGVAGSRVRCAYHLFLRCLCLAYNLLHVQSWQQKVESSFFGLLVVVYDLLTICLSFAYSLLTTCYPCRLDNKLGAHHFWCC